MATLSAAGLVHLQRQGDVAVVRLDRPKVNALSLSLLGQLADVLRGLAAEPPQSVVLWGGELSFSAGADIRELLDEATAPLVSPTLQETLDLLAALPRVTVAAITRFALGGGLELALACDLRVAAEDARLGLPEVRLGVIPGGGGTQRLPRLIGQARAKELVLSGRQLAAGEAASIGLVDRVVPAPDVLTSALELASQFACGAPAAQAAAKRAINEGLALPLDGGLALERRLFDEVRKSPDATARMRAVIGD